MRDKFESEENFIYAILRCCLIFKYIVLIDYSLDIKADSDVVKII